MNYVFDSSSFINAFHYYYPENFPSFWEFFFQYIKDGRIVSVRSVKTELKDGENALSNFVEKHDIFTMPTDDETSFIATIFSEGRFLELISKKAILSGKEVADPYLIAKAKIIDACVVTQEKHKPNAAKIPNVCEHFSVPCVSLEGFMKKEGWVF